MSISEKNEAGETFGQWLLKQKDRGDWVDDLAGGARLDRGFPRNGSPEEVRRYLQKQQADGNIWAAMEDAEADWRAA